MAAPLDRTLKSVIEHVVEAIQALGLEPPPPQSDVDRWVNNLTSKEKLVYVSDVPKLNAKTTMLQSLQRAGVSSEKMRGMIIREMFPRGSDDGAIPSPQYAQRMAKPQFPEPRVPPMDPVPAVSSIPSPGGAASPGKRTMEDVINRAIQACQFDVPPTILEVAIWVRNLEQNEAIVRVSDVDRNEAGAILQRVGIKNAKLRNAIIAELGGAF